MAARLHEQTAPTTAYTDSLELFCVIYMGNKHSICIWLTFSKGTSGPPKKPHKKKA